MVALRFGASRFLAYTGLKIGLMTEDALPLSTRGSDIVDAYGNTVKLAGVNWPSHMNSMIPEGLQHRSADAICDKIVEMGFNMVRLTFPIQMVDEVLDNDSPRMVKQTLNNDGMYARILSKNPWVDELAPMQVFDRIVMKLSERRIMVIIDNHVSRAGWCCSFDDGNGFFNDRYFNPDKWLRGLRWMASRYINYPFVVGYSVRNELRTRTIPRNESIDIWFNYMVPATSMVSGANPKALVILSGLDYDTDLSFIRTRPLELLPDKLVYELHWYSWSGGNWDQRNTCNEMKWRYQNQGLFMVTQKKRPVLLTEFGANLQQFGLNNWILSPQEEKYMQCVVSVLSETGIGFAIWGLQGSYYYRDQWDSDESYGLLTHDWSQVRSSRFLRLIQGVI